MEQLCKSNNFLGADLIVAKGINGVVTDNVIKDTCIHIHKGMNGPKRLTSCIFTLVKDL